MKRAKVSAVYEGGSGRKRCRAEEEKEEGNSPKMARQRAKARKYGSRANARTPCGLPTGRTITTRSMATSSNLVEVEKGNQEMGKVVVMEEEEKRSEINVVEPKRVGGVAEMLEEELKRLDWPPLVLSYEEEHWLGGMKWDPYWDLMTGDVWLGGEGLEANDWVVNIWDI